MPLTATNVDDPTETRVYSTGTEAAAGLGTNTYQISVARNDPEKKKVIKGAKDTDGYVTRWTITDSKPSAAAGPAPTPAAAAESYTNQWAELKARYTEMAAISEELIEKGGVDQGLGRRFRQASVKMQTSLKETRDSSKAWTKSQPTTKKRKDKDDDAGGKVADAGGKVADAGGKVADAGVKAGETMKKNINPNLHPGAKAVVLPGVPEVRGVAGPSNPVTSTGAAAAATAGQSISGPSGPSAPARVQRAVAPPLVGPPAGTPPNQAKKPRTSGR